ncbi:uncharacterized protein LOC126474247 [Schistocerca serialis cubense]|uniref:uncharacterized protein LOC126474247 n=1 Tax=Schistocerca serialis cubense TaxID=2023355 RepID=UPI00214E1A98|nr:uncharacterized protein LOC126474247 [Schistocerca serialis cubense]
MWSFTKLEIIFIFNLSPYFSKVALSNLKLSIPTIEFFHKRCTSLTEKDKSIFVYYRHERSYSHEHTTELNIERSFVAEIPIVRKCAEFVQMVLLSWRVCKYDKDWQWSTYPPPTKQFHQHPHGREAELLSDSERLWSSYYEGWTCPPSPQKFGEIVSVVSINSEERKKFKCPNCLKGYCSRGTLLRHLKLECGKDPQFHCPNCSYQTKHKSNLQRHLAIHRID